MSINKKQFLIVFILYLLLILLFFGSVIFRPERLLSAIHLGDVFSYFSATKFLETESLRRGIILWNSNLFCGTPWIANPQYQLFYPLNFPLLFLPFHLSINYSFIFHIFLIGIATFLFVSYLGFNWYVAMISGLISMLNGQIFLRCFAGHLSTINTYFWLTLIFLLLNMCLRKKRVVYAILAGLSLGCQILAGNPQFVYYTLLAVFFYFSFIVISDLFKTDKEFNIKFISVSLFIFLVVGIGISALRLIPILEFSRFSDRAVNSLPFISSWSFPPENLITYLLPEFFGDIINVPYWGQYNLWEMCGYLGILPLILSIIALIYRRNKYTLFFACLAVLALVASLGRHTPLLKFFYYFLPGFSNFRGHSKFLILFVFSIGILSAYGLSWLLEKRERLSSELKRIVLLLGIFAGAVTLLVFASYFNQPRSLLWWIQSWKAQGWPLEIAGSAYSYALFSLMKFNVILVSIFLLCLLWMKKSITPRIFKFFIAAIIIADLGFFGAKYIVSDNVKRCYWDKETVKFLKDNQGIQPYRVLTYFLEEFFPNNAVFDEISVLNGYDPLILKRHDIFLRFCSSQPLDSPATLKLFNLANLKYIILPSWMELNNPDLKVVFEKANIKVWENAGCLPRAYIVHSAKTIKENDATILKTILDNDFDPLNTVILEQDNPIETDLRQVVQRDDETVSFLKYSHNEVIIQAELQKDGYLILSDVHYPGWRADVLNITTGQSEEVGIFHANYIFRGIPLKKGDYLVRYLFRPVSFYIGCIISALTSILVVIILIFTSRTKKYS